MGSSVKVSNSSAPVPLGQKIAELAAFFRMRLQDMRHPPDVLAEILAGFAEYDALLSKYAEVPLQQAKVFEVGFGARPYRLMTLMSLGIDAAGVDLDVPVWKGTPKEFFRMYRKNGAERVVKSLLRFVVFDRLERRRFIAALKERGNALTVQPERFLINDAAALRLPHQSLDLIFSVDVFEHVPRASLEALIPQMARWLRPRGLALLRVGVYTGIIGGHLADWFPHVVKDSLRKRKSEPWEHLRKKRYQANTYLNQLTRAEYRSLFNTSFDILEERVEDPNLGREFLTPDVQHELRDYPDEELFSNLVLFVLQPKGQME